jgi:hypothetical protein
MRVTLAYPGGSRREVLLAGVPRKGEHVRVVSGRDQPDAPVLVVESVTWVEGDEKPPEPIVIVAVRQRAP